MLASLGLLWAALLAGTLMLSLWLRPYIAPFAGRERLQAPSADPWEDAQIRRAEVQARNPLVLIWKVRLSSIGTPFLKALVLAARIGAVTCLASGLALIVFGSLEGRS
jgi:hypothetical protein